MKSFNFGGNREDIGPFVTHRMSIGRFFKPAASPSRAAPKSLTCQKIQEGHTMVQFRVEFASTSWHLMRPSYHIGNTSFFCRVVIGTIGLVLPHEGNTRDTRCCPIVLGRQHDIVWPSQRHRISIVYEKSRARWHQDGNTKLTKTVLI